MLMARIVLAEDDSSMRSFLTTALERAGHQVYPCENGEKALAAVGTKRYDLLLSDIVMPGMDGITLARHAVQEAPDTKIMFITGFAAIAMTQLGDLKHKAAVYTKPFHLRDLVAQVDTFLAKSSAA
jgi:two-component system cell cycle response regulator CpdR